MKAVRNIVFLALSVVLGAGVAPAADTAEAVIRKARASLGPEAVLDGVKSIHYFGTVETKGEGDQAGKMVSSKIELIFQKPCQQRVVVTDGQKSEVSCLDDYEGWQRQQDLKNPQDWVMTLMTAEQVRGLRAATWENLSFFRSNEAHGGRVEDWGLADADGVKCRKLAYIYGEDSAFIRYFSTATGKLVLTETDQGNKIRESGEITVNGLRFPKQIITTNSVEGEPDRVVTITFDRITLNETFPGSLFQVPPPKG